MAVVRRRRKSAREVLMETTGPWMTNSGFEPLSDLLEEFRRVCREELRAMVHRKIVPAPGRSPASKAAAFFQN